MGALKESLESGKGRRRQKRSEKKFRGLTETPLAEISQYQEKMAKGALPGLAAADKQTALALREGGVRGPQAAIERSRQAGIRTSKLDEAISKYDLEDAMRRRDAALQYFGTKGAA